MKFFTAIAVFFVSLAVFSVPVYAESSDYVQVTVTPVAPDVKLDLIEQTGQKFVTNISIEDVKFYMEWRALSAERVVPYGWKYVDNKGQWHVLAVKHYQEHGNFIRVLMGWYITNLPKTELVTDAYIVVTEMQRLDGDEWDATMALLREIVDNREKLSIVEQDLAGETVTNPDVLSALRAEQSQLIQAISELEDTIKQGAVVLLPKEESIRILAEYQRLRQNKNLKPE